MSHNGIWRGSNLGTISNLNEYIAFRNAHGIADHTYTALYLGDYFKIQDGTYNAEWMVAHFDYYYNKGDDSNIGAQGVLLIPKTYCGESKLNATEDTTEGGYKETLAYNTVCPAIASALGTVLGSYLKPQRLFVTTQINSSIPSMAGLGWSGASTRYEFASQQVVLPSEVQIYGTTLFSSSCYDNLSLPQKLAAFNFIGHTQYYRKSFWLSCVSSSNKFCDAGIWGNAGYNGPSNSEKLRPLIYIS